MTKKSILNWLDEQANQGDKVCIRWDGGGDSGWAYFEIDGQQVDNEYTEILVDKMYDVLDYGSWAGEFNASGTATYNPKTKSFEGTDFYGEDENEVIDTNIVLRVPKSFWFNTLHIECEANYDETPNVSIRFIVRNGFLTDQHTDFCSNLENNLSGEFEAIFSNYESVDGYEFRGCNDSWIIDRNEFTEEDDDLVYTITKIDLQIMTNDEKEIVLHLDDEFVEDINERLNNNNED